MKRRHKLYHCTSLKRAGIQFAVSCFMTWFGVGLATEQPVPSQWSPEVKVIAFIMTVIFTTVLFTNEVREERDSN